MGLDHYIFEVSRPKLDPAETFDEKELYDYICFPCDLDDEDMELYADLIPFCKKLRVCRHNIDFDALRSALRIPKKMGLTMIDRTGYHFISGDKERFVSRAKAEEFIVDTVAEEYVVKQGCDVKTWRKEYVIQDWFHDRFRRERGIDVKNCGYYYVDIDTIEAFNEAFHEAFPHDAIPDSAFDEDDSGYGLFYHEWY